MLVLSEIKQAMIDGNEIGVDDSIAWLGHGNKILVNGIGIYEVSYCRDRGLCKLHYEYVGIYTPNLYSY